MALTRVKTWSAGEVLLASDLNAEFNNILNNALTLISPLTGTLDANGNKIVLDADADTSITADTDDRLDLELGGTDLFRWNTVTSAVNGIDFFAAATGSDPYLIPFGSDTNIDLNLRGKGTGSVKIEGERVGRYRDSFGSLAIFEKVFQHEHRISEIGSDANTIMASQIFS